MSALKHIGGVNPWDSHDRRWSCRCAECKATRAAWAETTRVWKPRKGVIVQFGHSTAPHDVPPSPAAHQ